MNLFDLSPKSTSFSISFRGRKRTLMLRPFILRDDVWLQKTFDQEELRKKIYVEHDIETVARIIWYQLSNKAKKYIMRLPVNYEDIDPHTGAIIKVQPHGFRRLIEVLDNDSLGEGLEAYVKNQELNAPAKVQKKKTLAQRIGWKFFTL